MIVEAENNIFIHSLLLETKHEEQETRTRWSWLEKLRNTPELRKCSKIHFYTINNAAKQNQSKVEPGSDAATDVDVTFSIKLL